MGIMDQWKQESTYSTASGQNYHYVVLQEHSRKNCSVLAPEISQSWRM